MANLVDRETKSLTIASWGIEADHPRNCDLMIQCIPNGRLRGAIQPMREAIDVRTGESATPIDQARDSVGLPRIPGQQLHIHPAEGRVEIIDPLCEDPQMCERITKWLRNRTGFTSTTPIKGVAKREEKLDIHRMKTLCREVLHIVTCGEARKIRGPLPDQQDIDDMPGYYLLNPGIRTGTTQPVYEKDWAAWVEALSHSGG
jgi:hypothetical protein